MKASRSRVREGVSLRYLFHTCRAISCTEECELSELDNGVGRGEGAELATVEMVGAGVEALGVDDTER